MYLPKYFQEPDNEKLRETIRRYGFGILIVAGDKGVDANHMPFYLNPARKKGLGILECHVARQNPVWKNIEDGASVLTIFQGPDAYISPSWYPSKAETGRVVPTWNYLAVHARGRARTRHDADWLTGHLNRLTNQHESGRDNPWSVAGAPAQFTDKLMKAIVGIEIEVEELTGKLKASQNLSEQDRQGVREGLSRERDRGAREMANYMD